MQQNLCVSNIYEHDVCVDTYAVYVQLWCSMQRNRAAAGLLRPTRVAALRGVGFHFDPHGQVPEPASVYIHRVVLHLRLRVCACVRVRVCVRFVLTRTGRCTQKISAVHPHSSLTIPMIYARTRGRCGKSGWASSCCTDSSTATAIHCKVPGLATAGRLMPMLTVRVLLVGGWASSGTCITRGR